MALGHTVTLRWQASTDPDGPGDIAGYNIYRDSAPAPIASVGPTTLEYTDGGLAALTTYTYDVTAFDLAGNESPISNLVQATTGADPTPLPDPTQPHKWRFVLCNRSGTPVAVLENATMRQITIGVSMQGIAEVHILAEDTAAAYAANIAPLRLKVYRDGVLRFHGEVWQPSETLATDSSDIAFIALDATQNLAQRVFAYNQRVIQTGAADDIFGQILTTLADLETAPVRIGHVTGTSPTKKITWPPGQTARDALNRLATVGNSIDYIFRPTEGDFATIDLVNSAGTVPVEYLGELDLYYPNAGVDSQAEFSLGYDHDNISQIQRQSDRRLLVNRAYARSAGPNNQTIEKFAERQNLRSRDVEGTLEALTEFQNVRDLSGVQELAYQMLQLAPQQTVTISPLANSPKPWDDFQLGDTVLINARRGNVKINGRWRVYQILITIDQDGLEQLGDITLGAGSASGVGQ